MTFQDWYRNNPARLFTLIGFNLLLFVLELILEFTFGSGLHIGIGAFLIAIGFWEITSLRELTPSAVWFCVLAMGLGSWELVFGLHQYGII